MSLANLSHQMKLDKYAISVASKNRNNKHCILVAFSEGADGEAKAKAYFHAILLGNILRNVGAAEMKTEQYQLAEATAAADVKRLWLVFAKSSNQAGWNLHKTELRSEGYELSLK